MAKRFVQFVPRIQHCDLVRGNNKAAKRRILWESEASEQRNINGETAKRKWESDFPTLWPVSAGVQKNSGPVASEVVRNPLAS